MGLKFTGKQQKVIDFRNKNLLVSAAAGSGKTAVLVERIVNIISDSENPIDVDRLLVVTFTNAAAQEMKERVLDAIEKRQAQNPDDEHLIKQKTYIHSAQITTIHSFCLNLIKENFNAIDIDPIFRIADEAELKLLKADIVSELLGNCYEEASEEFGNFIEAYSGNKSDENIEELILKIYEFSRSHPYPEEWFDNCEKNYSIEKEELSNTNWMKELDLYVDEILKIYLNQLNKAISICEESDGPYMYGEAIESDISYISRIIKEKDFDKRELSIRELNFQRLSGKKDVCVNPDKREKVKSIRDEIKDGIKSIKKDFYFSDSDSIVKDMKASLNQVKVLTYLAREFTKLFTKAKREKNILDFNDLEHFSLEILVKKDKDKITTTQIADELAEYFAEVMIDEYQDSNLIQEMILTSVSSQRFGKSNLICVGDVKQSIYKFRMACPELFIEKYEKYSDQDDSIDQRINLDVNFRSRKQVINAVNSVFEATMKKSLGGIEYDAENSLYLGADYPELPENQNNEMEILVVEDVENNGKELEAAAIATKIKELVDSGFLVKDKITGEMRSAKYSDIVILLRGVKVWADVFEQVFYSEGIPSYSESSEGYFNAMEVRTVLNMLTIIDNPRQDIPLAAVLKSQMVNFNSNDLAKIKSSNKKMSFFDMVLKYSIEGEDKILKIKVLGFLNKLDGYRTMSEYMSVYEILSYVLMDTDYYNIVLAMPGGVKRKANLDLLLDKAINYENTSYSGLFNFIRYVEKLKKLEVDFSEASVSGEKDNVVRMMTIHKSKGLEFPIVFVSGLGKTFNIKDSSGKIILHSELGIGADYIEPDNRIKDTTLIKEAISRKIKMENLGEELRILYVALTRAKEKLILTGNVKNVEKSQEKWQQEINFYTLTSAKNYLDWIMPAIKCHEEFNIEYLGTDEIVYSKIKSAFNKKADKESLVNWDTDHIYNEKVRQEIVERLSYEYPYVFDTKLNIKMSVSEIKKINMKVDNDKFQEEEYVPEFIQSKQVVVGAIRGTAYHKIFETIDFREGYTHEELEEYIRNLGLGDVVLAKDILGFFESPIGIRMTKANLDNKLYKEKQYVMGIKAADIDEEYKGEELVLVQGIIDAYFEERNELVIVDYKTDKVKTSQELLDRYKTQLDFYEKALVKITGKRVKEKIIYSTELRKEVVL